MPRRKADDKERVPFGTRLEPQLLRELKRVAFDEERELYLVVEEAIRQYLIRKGYIKKTEGRGKKRSA